MNIFLKLKHWQLFLLLTGWIVVEIISPSKEPTIVSVVFLYFNIAILLAWLYALGINLNKKLPDTVKMNLKIFKCFLFTVPIGCLVAPFIYGILGELLTILFVMFCILYCVYFVAKSLKAVELQRPVSFYYDYDNIATFFLFLLFPIGVWAIQPKVNKIFDEKLTRHSALDAESHRSGDCGSSPQ